MLWRLGCPELRQVCPKNRRKSVSSRTLSVLFTMEVVRFFRKPLESIILQEAHPIVNLIGAKDLLNLISTAKPSMEFFENITSVLMLIKQFQLVTIH